MINFGSLKKNLWDNIYWRIPLMFIVVISLVYAGGKGAMKNRVDLNIRGELIVSEVSFRVRAEDASTPVALPALTQIQLTQARLVDSSELKIINPSLPDTTFSGLPRRSSFLFAPTPNDSLLVWIDALALPDSGFVRVVVGREDPLGLRLTVSSPGGEGQIGFILHRDTAAELKTRGSGEPIVVALEKGASVSASPRKMMQLRARLETPEPGFSVSDGLPVRELSFTRSHTDESSKTRSSIVSGRLEFDEDWLNPDRRGEAGEVPGFDLEPGDYLHVAAPDLVVNDLEFLMLDDRLHFKVTFSGTTNVLKTRSGKKLKDGRLTRAEYWSLHPFWRLFYKMLYEVLGLAAGLLSLWWMYQEQNSSKDSDGEHPALMRKMRGKFRRGLRRRSPR